MAGFWHLSHHQMRDPNGRVYAGARAVFYSATTLDPITVYQDYGLGTEHPSVVEANGYGVFPPVFFDEDDEFYRQRITTAGGVLIPGTDVGTLPIIGPSGGGGGSEVPVDENSLLQTGDPLWVPVTGTRSGFVRMNGRTIGSASSGASERANADCEALFAYNWNTYTDSYAAVSGGRGASATADWSANKTIALLDMRGRSPFGLDDMGNSAASSLTGVPFALGNATTAAAKGGASTHTLALTETPAHDHGGVTGSGNTALGSSTADAGAVNNIQVVRSNVVGVLGAHTHTITSAGGGTAHNNVPLMLLGTWYQRL